MEKTYIKICLKKNKQRLKESQKIYCRAKTYSIFCLSLFIWYKMEQKTLTFGEDCINKNTFHKNKRAIIIDEVDIKRVVLSS